MELKDINLALYGGGKMGMAMLSGWLAQGMAAENVAVFDPFPSADLQALGVKMNPQNFVADVYVLAVKPQIMDALLAGLNIPKTSLVISVAAGCPIAQFEKALGEGIAIIRTMPNTPAAVGAGMTVIVGNRAVGKPQLALAEKLMSAVGEVAQIADESLMDAVTGLSGSGPAYVFYMIETMTQAGIKLGLEAGLAEKLAMNTVAGSGKLVKETGVSPSVLRQNVTSPNGTTAAGLAVLMDAESGLAGLMETTINAATARSKELGKT